MKVLLQTRVIIILLLSISVTAAIMSGCSSDQGNRTGGTTSGTSDGGDRGGDRNDRRNNRRAKGQLKCELPSCSGSSCCDKEDNDGDLDEDCEDWCKKDLNLSGNAYDLCLALDKDVVENDLLFLFDDRLNRPNFEDLERLKTADIEIICAAVKHLDSDLLSDRIDKYGSADAKAVLEWMATEDTVLEIFDNADEDEGVKMVKKLLETVGGGSGDNAILQGLGVNISHDNDEDEHVFQSALSASNEKFVDYLHDEIIIHEKEICAKANQPVPVPNKAGEGKTVDGSDGNCLPGGTGGIKCYVNPPNGFGYEACVLAAYCTIAPLDDANDNEFRKDIADFINQTGVVNFIKRSAEDGGLDPVALRATETRLATVHDLTEEDAEEWTSKACSNLKHFWNNASGKTGLFDIGDE